MSAEPSAADFDDGSKRVAEQRRDGKLFNILLTVIPSLALLSSAPFWWHGAQLFWNKVAHPIAPPAAVAPISPDDVVVPMSAKDDVTDLFVIDAASGQIINSLTTGGTGVGAPSIAKDRRTIFYTDASGNVRLIDAAGGGGRIVFRTDSTCPYVRHVSASRDPNRLLLQCRDRQAPHQTDAHDFFEFIDLQGLFTGTVRTTSSKIDDPTLSPDGRYLAYWGSPDTDVEGYPGGSIYVLDLQSDQEPKRLTSGSLDMDPAWAPNSKSLAFTRKEDGKNVVFRMSTSDDEPTEVVKNAAKPSWSDDGRLVAVRSLKDDKLELISFKKSGQRVVVSSRPQKTIYAPVWSSR
jgi:Tol biopolymer transport system component